MKSNQHELFDLDITITPTSVEETSNMPNNITFPCLTDSCVCTGTGNPTLK